MLQQFCECYPKSVHGIAFHKIYDQRPWRKSQNYAHLSFALGFYHDWKWSHAKLSIKSARIQQACSPAVYRATSDSVIVIDCMTETLVAILVNIGQVGWGGGGLWGKGNQKIKQLHPVLPPSGSQCRCRGQRSFMLMMTAMMHLMQLQKIIMHSVKILVKLEN